MELYEAYSKEIIDRSKLGLGPKPIDQGDLIIEIIDIHNIYYKIYIKRCIRYINIIIYPMYKCKHIHIII